MTHPLDAEARKEIHPDAYEILKAATNDHAEFFEIDGKTYSLVDVKSAYRAVSATLEMRDAERAEVERLKRSVSQALFELSPDRDTHSQAKCRAARDILQIALRRLSAAHARENRR